MTARRNTTRILGKTWTIDWSPMKKLFGRCLHQQLKIRVCTDKPLQQQQDTLLHEVTHAYDLELGLDLGEKKVGRLATNLLGWMKDNPGLVRWMLKNK